MKICLSCDARFAQEGWRCPRCGSEPAQLHTGIIGFTSATEGESFEAGFFDELAAVEEGSFWFRSRNRLVVWALGRFFPQATSLLEVGCGNGFVLQGVQAARPDLTLTGAELFPEGLIVARSRLPEIALLQLDARQMPFDSEFDVIGAFDVLEHISEDDEVLRQFRQAVKPGGGILLTVPQHPWLWSSADDYAHHKRRYTRAGLAAMVAAAGFEVIHTTSFIVALLPLLVASRLRRRHLDATFDPIAELQLGRVADRTLEGVTSAELMLTKRGLRWPAGGSLVLVGRRALEDR